jgi:hypothetical protein
VRRRPGSEPVQHHEIVGIGQLFAAPFTLRPYRSELADKKFHHVRFGGTDSIDRLTRTAATMEQE